MRRLLKLLALLRVPAYRRGLANGVAAGVEHGGFLRSLPVATVIDAGTNKGQFALAARAERPEARIIAFEPLPQLAAAFQKLFQGDNRTEIRSCALGSARGTAPIHLSRRMDSSSLLKIGRGQAERFPGTDEIGNQTISVERLDEAVDTAILASPVLLKIDVQGFELEVLKGAEHILQHIDHIYVELSFVTLYERQPLAPDVIAWLMARGFGLAGVYHIAFDHGGAAVQADMHFSKIQQPQAAGEDPGAGSLR